MSDIAKPFIDGLKGLWSTALPGRTVYLNGVTDDDPDYPYLVLWGGPPNRTPVNLAGNLVSANNLVQVVAIGRDVYEVITLLERAGAAVIGRKLSIEGWGTNFVREIPQNQPVEKNAETLTEDGRPTFRGWTMYQMSADPAPIAGS